MTVKDQYHLKCAIFMHQLKMGTPPKSFNNLKLKYFTTPVRCIILLDNLKLMWLWEMNILTYEQLARAKLSALLHYHKSPQIWNSIENRFREIKSTRQFKLSLGVNLIENYAEQVTCKIRNAPNDL